MYTKNFMKDVVNNPTKEGKMACKDLPVCVVTNFAKDPFRHKK